MCTIPPPPPPLPSKSSIINNPTTPENVIRDIPNSDLCQWVKNHPELRETCIKNNICLYKEPFQYKYRYFESIQQAGPTCGLVALSMLLNGRISANKILDHAKDLGYTNNGEMFSCKQLAILGAEIFKMANVDATFKVQTCNLYSQETVNILLDGAVLLVPYDADCNHSPCLKYGHTAHWALICGIIMTKDRDFGIDPLNIHILAKHGKSKYLAAWKLEDLERSNENLMEFSPKKSVDGLVYVLPDGGIGGENGLRNQFIVVEGF